MKVPFLDLVAAHNEIRNDLEDAFRRVRAAGTYILGPEVEAFEREFADYCGTGHCIGVGNGFDAIQLLLRGAGIGPGDEVIVPAYTAVATWMAVSAVGAVPIGADIDPDRWTIDPEEAAAAVTPRTRAILPVHLFGLLAEIETLNAVAERHGVLLVEDAAQAHGARYRGRRVGNLATAGCFSFYPTKNLGALGDGGAVTTSDDELADRVRLLRTYGWRHRSNSETKGLNSRLDELQAALLRVKLARLDEWNDRRRAIADRYFAGLADVDGLRLPRVAAGTVPVWHLFVVFAEEADLVRRRLAEDGIQTLIHYDPLPHLTPAYQADGWREGAFPVAEELAAHAISLPMYPQLAPDACDRVVVALRRE